MTGTAFPMELDELARELANDEQERQVIASALRLLAHAAPEAEPDGGLRERLLARVAEERSEPAFTVGPSYFARAAQLPWTPIAEGVELKVLHQDAAAGTRTLLIRMAPNRPFPPHDHHAIEDLFLIEGDAWVGDVHMNAGEYCRAEAGSAHNDVRSGAAGALAFVVSR
jgi:anti-sigma factor ChrR (cupin superfamily)